MSTRFSIAPLLTVGALVALSGCGQQAAAPSTTVAESDEGLLAEILGDIDLTEARPQEPRSVPAEPASTGATSSETTAFVQPAQVAAPAPSLPAIPQIPAQVQANNPPLSLISSSMDVGLKVGESFRLIRTSRQQLSQQSGAVPATAQSELEQHIVLSVREVRGPDALIDVSWERIRFNQDLDGRQTFFDSYQHQGTVPSAATLYYGMLNARLSFWMGSDFSIRKVEGLEAFLQTCVQHIESKQQITQLNQLRKDYSVDTVQKLIDPSLGLIPNPLSIKAGDLWTAEQPLNAVVAATQKFAYRVDGQTNDAINIKMTGVVAAEPSVTTTPGSVIIRGGRSIGSWTIDRRTGLPQTSTGTTFLTMDVVTEKGLIRQIKRIDTSLQVTSLQNSRPGPVVQATQNPQHLTTQQSPGPSRGNIVPASAVIPTEPVIDDSILPSTATAVYPGE